ncbi:unnamed protein product [Paramecium sonneborni]|uniref:Peptidase M14 domain-containing protein n=1 Tax=Paramecium sonneborni TaxID=65129 RepID=A0A8S1LR25_9CILI|nr:unnamed protein product [Paramecium sonneborni]
MQNQDVDLIAQPFLNSLPKAITLTDHSFSLENDMLLGWAPKLDYSKLLTLNFTNPLNDSIIAHAQLNNQLLYLGFRPQDTGQLHKQYSNTSTYPFKSIKILQRKPQLPFLGMNPNLNSRIQFNSTFESGNLDLVVKNSQNQYDLYMRVDSNTKGHTSWYNFEIKGMKKTEVIQLNICNFRKSRTLYERGMKPYIWRSTNPEWLQGGEQIQYKTHYHQHYNCLSFQLVCQGDNEIIKIAYCVPYTFTQMLEFCGNMQKNCNYVEKTTFCESLSGVQLPLYTFSNGNCQNQKCMIIQSRIHPGESNGSWVMQGLLEFLSSQQGLKLIKKCVIKVVPMMNPDGVILGNYRTGIAGKDLNRRFKLTDHLLFPTVTAMKKLVKEQYSIFGNNLIGFIDLHGHSVKKNVFLYGPEFPLWNYNYYKCRILAKLLGQKTEMFRYYSSIFRISQQKKSTARGVFVDLYDIVNCFTIESSNGSYYNSTQTFEFTCKHWIQMGWIIGEALTDLVEMQNEMDVIYNLKNDETKRSNRQIKNQMFNKKRSFTGYQEDQCQAQFQNTKFANIFDELKQDADKMNQSLSEEESDSSDDDGSETYLEDIKQQLLMDGGLSKSKLKDKPIISIMQPIQKSKIEQRFSPRLQQQQSSQQSIMLSIQKSEKKFNNPSRSVQNSIIKKVSSNSQSKKSTKISNYITNYASGQNSATLVFQEDYNSNQIQPLQQLMQATLQRPSTAHLEVTEDEMQFPVQLFNTSNYNVFKQHTRLRSKITINKQIKDQKKIQSKSHQTTPPLLQQMGINVKNKINTQSNLEQLGLKVKPQHFLAPKKSEEPLIADLNKNMNSFLETQKSTRPPKPNVPPSFYSVKRHMMLRLKN